MPLPSSVRSARRVLLVAAVAATALSTTTSAADVPTLPEGSEITLTIELAEPARKPGWVSISQIGGSAIEGKDFERLPRRVRFGKGDTSKSFVVRVLDDHVIEPEETIHLGFKPKNVSFNAEPYTIAIGDTTRPPTTTTTTVQAPPTTVATTTPTTSPTTSAPQVTTSAPPPTTEATTSTTVAPTTTAAPTTTTSEATTTTQVPTPPTTSTSTTTVPTPAGGFGQTVKDFGQMRYGDWADILRVDESQILWTYHSHDASIVTGPEGNELRQRFVPGSNGSGTGTPVVQAVMELEPSDGYWFTQEVFLEPDTWAWGNSENQIGKLGLGFTGGTHSAGGTIDPAGFSSRIMWLHGDEASAYTYNADRGIRYGQQNPTGFSIPVGEWVRMDMEVVANSDHNTADGQLRVWMNEQLVLERTDMLWQTEGSEPTVDRLVYSTFYGGSGQQYAPDQTTYARFRHFYHGPSEAAAG